MSSIKHVLEVKISELTDEISELGASLERAEERRQIYLELLEEELSDRVPVAEALRTADGPPKKRGRGRPPKEGQGKVISLKESESAHAPNDQLFEEAVRTLPAAPTTSEEQKRAIQRFRTAPRAQLELGSAVAGPGRKDLPTKTAVGHTVISVDEEEEVSNV